MRIFKLHKRTFSIMAAIILISLFAAVSISAAKRKPVVVTQSRCVGCGECVTPCPVQAISIVCGKAVIDPKKCRSCRMCAYICSYGAPR